MRSECLCLFVVSLAVSAVVATAGTRYWDPALAGGTGSGGNGTWDGSAVNWSDGSLDRAWVNANGDDAVFQNGAGTASLGAETVVRNVIFNTAHNLNLNYRLIITNSPTVTVAGGLDVRWNSSSNLSGNCSLTKDGPGTLRFNSGAPVYSGGTVVNAGILTFDNNGVLPVNGDVAVAAGAMIDFYTTADPFVGRISGSGVIQCGSFQDRVLTVGGNNADCTFTGTLRDNSNGRKLAVVKRGTGTLVFGGTNTFSGGMTIGGGIVSISATNNIGGSALNVNGGFLRITGVGLTNLDNMTIYWNTLKGGGLEVEDSCNVFTVTNPINASVSNNGMFVFDMATDGEYRGVISGTGNVVKAGNGILTVCAAQVYSGATVITGGTLRLFVNPPPTSVVVSSTATNIVWLDARDFFGNGSVPVGGAVVSTWTNKAPGGSAAAHFTLQTSGGVSYTTNSSVVGCQAAVHFDGTGMLATSTDIQSPVSIFYVGGLSGGQNVRLMGSTSMNFLLGYWNNCMNSDYWNGVGAFSSGNAASPPDNAGHIWCGTHSGSVYNSYRTDCGGIEWKFDTGSGGGGPGRLALGGGDTGVNNMSRCDISEVLVYNNVLNDADRGKVEAYLHNKWLGMPSGYGQGALPSNTTVYISNGAWLDTGGTTQTVRRLYLDGRLAVSGTYGAVGSGAVRVCTNYFAGAGVLKVTDGFVGGTVIIIR